MRLHIQPHLKPRTVEQYSGILRRILVPRFGERELTDIRRTHVVRLHLSLGDRRTAANRMPAVGSGLYRYANLLEETDGHSILVKFLNQLNHVCGVTPQAIKLLDQDKVTFFYPELKQAQPGSIHIAAAYLIGE